VRQSNFQAQNRAPDPLNVRLAPPLLPSSSRFTHARSDLHFSHSCFRSPARTVVTFFSLFLVGLFFENRQLFATIFSPFGRKKGAFFLSVKKKKGFMPQLSES
jgi:hypothetical protein